MERRTTDDAICFLKDGNEIATIQETIQDGQVIISLKGSFPGELANDLMDEISALMIAKMGIVVDAGAAEYFASSIGEVFLRTEKKLEEQGKWLRIVNMPSKLFEEFKKKGLHDLLDIEVAK